MEIQVLLKQTSLEIVLLHVTYYRLCKQKMHKRAHRKSSSWLKVFSNNILQLSIFRFIRWMRISFVLYKQRHMEDRSMRGRVHAQVPHQGKHTTVPMFFPFTSGLFPESGRVDNFDVTVLGHGERHHTSVHKCIWYLSAQDTLKKGIKIFKRVLSIK